MYKQTKEDGYMAAAEAKKSGIKYKLENMYSDRIKCHEAHFKNRETHLTSVAQ
ncbi:hypothetical protein HBI76_094430 [Parastagonospora nodorum]|nr:hypothetical protein HBI76_094430 [Parastagonospora nodorum]